MTTTVDDLLQDYLGRLDRAAQRLPADRRDELLSKIREHPDGARAAGAAADEAAVRTLLDRLGEPEEIVASASEDVLAAVPSSYTPAGTGLETAAVVMPTVGSLVPIVGWLVGVALLWMSSRWTLRDKLLATLVTPGGPGLVLLVGLVVTGESCQTSIGAVSIATSSGTLVDVPPPAPTSSTTCSGGLPGPAWLPPVLGLLAVTASIAVAVHLLRRARRAEAKEPPRVVGPSPWGGLEIAAVLLIGLGSFIAPGVGTIAGLVCCCLAIAGPVARRPSPPCSPSDRPWSVCSWPCRSSCPSACPEGSPDDPLARDPAPARPGRRRRLPCRHPQQPLRSAHAGGP